MAENSSESTASTALVAGAGVAKGERFLHEIKRTHRCGDLREGDIGSTVVLYGWVRSARDQGGAIFVDLRDREGITQIVFDREHHGELHRIAEQLRREWVIAVRGKVRDRGAMRNPKLATGAIEVLATDAIAELPSP